MPAPGDQYKGGDVKNPFEERVVNGFTASEIATLQSRLNKQLGPEYISQRPGNGGGKVAYLEGNKAIALANEVFGFNGWSSSLGQVQIDYVDELQNGKVSLGLSIVVRITLKDGTYHEDIGYGSIENGKGKAASFEKAKKEAATDGLKRALRTFGNVLGNCLYDKQYLKKVQAMHVKPIKFQEDNLYRHTDFTLPAAAPENQAMIKREQQRTPARPNQVLRTRTDHLNESFSADFDDEADENLFDGVDVNQAHGNEASSDSLSAPDSAVPASVAVVRPNGAPSARTSPIRNTNPPRQPLQRTSMIQAGRCHLGAPQQHQNPAPARTGPPVQNQCQPQTPVHQNQPRPGQGRGQIQPLLGDNGMPPRDPGPQQQNPQQTPQNQPLRPTPPQPQHQLQQSRPAQSVQGPNTPIANPPPNNRPSVGFVTSRAAEMLQKAEAVPTHVPAFNPNVESPIPKEQRTPGFDATRSAPIKREAVGVAPAPQPPPGPPARTGSTASGGGAGNFNRPNVVNPHLDANRRIGAPSYAMSPSGNRGAYKPPTFANTNGAPANSLKRPALQDVSNHTSASGKVDGEGSHEAKKQRVEAAGAENASAVVGT